MGRVLVVLFRPRSANSRVDDRVDDAVSVASDEALVGSGILPPLANAQLLFLGMVMRLWALGRCTAAKQTLHTLLLFLGRRGPPQR